MSAVKRNLVANFVGIGWSGVLALALVPVYIRLLGPDAYGLVGFLMSLQAITALLDFGLATSVNRELAHLSGVGAGADELRSVIRTGEIVFWAIAAAFLVALFTAAPVLASRWFTHTELSHDVVATALRLIAVAVAMRFPNLLYSAGLYGLQRHVVVNAIVCAGATLRAAGTVLLLLFIARDVRLLFAWEATVAVLITAATGLALRVVMPASRAARFDRGVLVRMRPLMVGIGTIGVLAAIATQVDKLTVSRLLPLRTFGYYTIASTIAAIVISAVTVVSQTMFPRFAELVARRDEHELALAYRRGTETVGAILLPVVFVMMVFGRELVLLWTGDAAAANEMRWVVVLLVAGAALNAIMAVPYALQLAHAWTRPALVTNAVAVVLLTPATIIITKRFGAVGAASCWLAFHFAALVVNLIVMHRRLLPEELRPFVRRAMFVPAVVAASVCAVARVLVTAEGRLATALILVAVGGVALLLSALSTPVTRDWISEQWKSLA